MSGDWYEWEVGVSERGWCEWDAGMMERLVCVGGWYEGRLV